MKILIITQYFYPENFNINDIVFELSKNNEITIICGTPNYFNSDDILNTDFRTIANNKYPNVKIYWIKTTPRKQGSNLALILNYLSFAMNSNKFIKNLDEYYDIVYVYQLSPITIAIPAITYKKRFGTKVFTYCLDLWPESLLGHIGKIPLIYQYFNRLSKKIYNESDMIGITSQSFYEYLVEKHGIKTNKIAYLPQHCSENYLEINNKKVNFSCKKELLYAGNLGAGQKVDVIIKAANLLKDRKDFIIKIIGDGNQKNTLSKMIKDYHLENIVFLYGKMPFSDLKEHYEKASALLLTLRGNNFVGNTIPAKLQAYMGAGKPIIAAINGSASNIIKDAECGLVCEAENFLDFSKNIAFFLDNYDKYKNNGENGRKYFLKAFTLKKHIDDLERLLKICYEGKNY